MITEDYVSFETAKLLKEKGFDEGTNSQYPVYGIHCGEVGEYNITDRTRNPEIYIPAPTLQMAMKWLRKEHKLFIQIELGVCDCYVWNIIGIESGQELLAYNVVVDNYESACEAAIKYCLENLI